MDKLTPAQQRKYDADVEKERMRFKQLEGLSIVHAVFEPTREGTYTIVLSNRRTVTFTAVGDDMTYCQMTVYPTPWDALAQHVYARDYLQLSFDERDALKLHASWPSMNGPK